ncbi:TPA: hypothetical protein MH570_28370 [Klebsiella pneumoniae]|nr:hypothetical protein [Klebsiella pneumoniae]
MTDITELAQSLKAAADREMICRDVAETSEIWERTVTPENILALVEALEKAQAQSSKWLEAYHKAVSIGARYEERIAELESRTVKLPEPFKLAKSSSGLTYYYADEVDAALTAAGIKVEDE